MHPMFAEQINRQTALWQQHIPKAAVGVRETKDGKAYEYLHRTKGWKRVNKRRLGLDG